MQPRGRSTSLVLEPMGALVPKNAAETGSGGGSAPKSR
jgi:hypothetical protein